MTFEVSYCGHSAPSTTRHIRVFFVSSTFRNIPVDRVVYDETPEKLLINNQVAANSDIVRLLQVLKAKQPTPTITRLIAFYDTILFNTQYDTVHTLPENFQSTLPQYYLRRTSNNCN